MDITNRSAQRIADSYARIEDVYRHRDNGVGSLETWIVRDWEAPMRHYFDGVGATVRDVIDLDLEEGFVELLRSSRPEYKNGS